MKLRCTENSIRLRLRKSDIETLSQQQKVSDSVNFGMTTPLSYTLAISDTTQIEAKNMNSSIYIIVPKSRANKWVNSDQVSIEETVEFDNGQTLHVLIEKDFPCVDRENEDKSDTFFELAEEGKVC